jgi:AraC family transcriptional regulator
MQDTKCFEKYGPHGLLASSADRGWRGLAAELRSHTEGAAWDTPSPDAEVCVVLGGSRSLITRRLDNVTDHTVSERGTIWFCPPGVREGLVEKPTSDPLLLVHISLSSSWRGPDEKLDASAAASITRRGGFRDPLLAEMGYALAAELEHETAAGKLLAETLASSLTARLIQSQRGASPDITAHHPRNGLDQRRLVRVLDYIEANLEDDLTLARLASIACLSQFHFARAFRAAVGHSPHRYVSRRRLDRAKQLLRRADQPLADIALALQFSCQANFSRAFRQATGQTPAQYRRGAPS